MKPAIAIAEQILIDKLTGQKSLLTSEGKLKSILFILAGLLIFTSLCFFLYATFLWLNVNYTPITVMFSMAGVTLLFSLIFMSFILGFYIYKHRKIKQTRDEIFKVAEDALIIANYELSEPIKENPLTATLITTFAGYLAGQKFL